MYRSISVIVLLIGALLVGGCASNNNRPTPLVPRDVTVKGPGLQTETTVEIGQSIMFWAYGPAKTVIQLQQPFEFERKEHQLSIVGPDFTAVAMRGKEYIAPVSYILADGELTAVEPAELLLSAGSDGCAVIVDSSFSISEKVNPDPIGNLSGIFTGKRAIFGAGQEAQSYQIPQGNCRIDQSTIADSEDSFRKELVYLGRSGDTIQLAYREFYNNMARPAFTNTIQYDLSDSEVIGFQGARFRVLSATNTFFTYEVLKHLQ